MHRIDADGSDCRDVVDGYSATGHDLDPARGMFDHSTDLVESLIASVRTPGRQHAGHAQVDQFVQRGQTVGHHVHRTMYCHLDSRPVHASDDAAQHDGVDRIVFCQRADHDAGSSTGHSSMYVVLHHPHFVG